MKRLITISIIILLLPFVVMAHPGSLDSNGGHYNRKTGEYHYHSGEHKYGSSSSTTQTYYPYTPKPTVNATQSPTTKPLSIITATPEPEAEYSLGEKIFIAVCLFIFFGIPGIILLVALGAWFVDGVKFVINRIKEKQQNKKTAKATKITPVAEKANAEPLKKATKSVSIPAGYEIGSDALPYKTNRQYGWGREFNVFVTNNGEHYHRSKCKTIKNKKRKLMHRYNAIKRYKPCTYCKPKGYIDEWYIEYRGADKGREQLSFEE